MLKYSYIYVQILLAKNTLELQKSKNILHVYDTRWKLKVNKDSTKIIILEKGEFTKETFHYNNARFEIVYKFHSTGLCSQHLGHFLNSKANWQVKYSKLF